MAGNASDERRAAENRYKDAERAGVKGNDLAVLKAAYDAKKASEESQTGSSQASTPFGF